MTGKAEQKNFGTPDETRTFERGHVDWSTSPTHISAGSPFSPAGAGPSTSSRSPAPICATRRISSTRCQGTLQIVMADGTEFDDLPGDVTALPQGHDAWVVGDEPVVVVDWYGASNYART